MQRTDSRLGHGTAGDAGGTAAAASATLIAFTHLTAVGIWFGGPLSLLVLLWGNGRILARAACVRFHATLVRRGDPAQRRVQRDRRDSGPARALEDGNGRALLGKVGSIVPLLAVGRLNAFLLRLRLIDTAAQSCGNPAEATARLQRLSLRSVAAETGLAVAVLGAPALLAVLIPTRGALEAVRTASPQANGSSVYKNPAAADDFSLRLAVDPNRLGENTVRILLVERTAPVSNATIVRLQFTYADPKFGASQIELPSIGNAVHETSGTYFAQVGRWQVAVDFRRGGHDDALASFSFAVPDAAGNPRINRRAAVDPFASPTTLFTTAELGALLLVVAGLLPFV
jgi:hypothetical protein